MPWPYASGLRDAWVRTRRAMVESARVVEILHDLGETVHPRWSLGSGFILRHNVVLTAAHVLGTSAEQYGPHGTTVRCLDGTEHAASSVLARSDLLDLAVLAVPGLPAEPVKIARLDRSRIDVVRNVMAVGFPNYKFAADRPKHQQRPPAQPIGSVPTVEDLPGGDFVLKLEGGEPSGIAHDPTGSPWEGLSGGAVVYGEFLVGVAVEHRLAEGLGALHFVPFIRLSELPRHEQGTFLAVLGIADVDGLPAVNAVAKVADIPEELLESLHQIEALVKQGYLDTSEASTLKITAFKVSKGWAS